MVKKYIVDLDEAEISQLRSLTKTGKHKARSITRANILLMASEGYSDKGLPKNKLIKKTQETAIKR